MKRRRKSKGYYAPRCRRCGDPRLKHEKLNTGGYCDACKALNAKERRAATGSRLLAKAKPVRTETWEGREYAVVQLPPKRPRH